MRNLKRVLSLALSAIMLLGLMVMGTGAANVSDFADADQISNVEAAAITVGLGIFNGDGDNFLPNEKVDRGQMAAIICKILNGSDVDVSNFLGTGSFPDVPDWAEGYVNMCAGMGIIEGYPDGRFGATDPVCAWQASLMLQRALGWWDKNDNSKEINKLNVTSEGQKNCRLYDGLEGIGVDTELTRDNVAVMVYNALFAQRVHYDDVRGLYTKDNDRNVVVNSGTVDVRNTLAQNTYGLYSVDGQVVANGYTSAALGGTSEDSALTTVVFDAPVDLFDTGRTTTEEYDFEYNSGLDLIAHNVTVYYRLDRQNRIQETFAMVDKATLTGTIFVGDDGDMASAANALGFRRNTVMSVIQRDETILNYDMDVTIAGSNIGTNKAFADNKLLLISNSSNKQVDYVILLDQGLTTVSRVETNDGETTYQLGNFSASNDNNLPLYDGVKKSDYVIATPIGRSIKQDTYTSTADEDTLTGGGAISGADRTTGASAPEVTAFEKLEPVEDNIRRLVNLSGDTGRMLKNVVASTGTYSKSPVYSGISSNSFTKFLKIVTIGEASMAVDQDGKLIGLFEETAAEKGQYVYVAQFGNDRGTTSDGLAAIRVLTALIYLPDGTRVTRRVDLTPRRDADKNFIHKTSTSIDLINEVTTTAILEQSDANDYQVGSAVATDYDDLNKEANILDANSALDAASVPGKGIGIYYMYDNGDGSVRLVDPDNLDSPNGISANHGDGNKYVANQFTNFTSVQVTNNHALQMMMNYTVGAGGPSDNGAPNAPINLRPQHSTGLTLDGKGVLTANPRIYASDNTVYYFVNGSYKAGNLEVNVFNGVSAVPTFAQTTTSSIPEAWVSYATTGRNTVNAMLIHGIYAEMSGIYYYNQDDFNVERNPETNKFDIIFNVHTQTGGAAEMTLEGFNTSSAAIAKGRSILSGYYRFAADGPKALEGVAIFDTTRYTGNHTTTSATEDEVEVRGRTRYAVEATAIAGNRYDEYLNDNLYAQVGSTSSTNGTGYVNYGVIFDDARVVDLTGHSITTVKRLAELAKDNTIKISYSYDTDTYEVEVIYVTDYVGGAVVGPTPQSGTIDVTTLEVKIGTSANGYGGSLFYTKAYKNLKDAIAAADVISLVNSQWGNATNVDVNITAGHATNKYVDAVVAGNYASINGAAAALTTLDDLSGAGDAISGTVLFAGNYLIIAVGDNTPANGIDGYIVISFTN